MSISVRTTVLLMLISRAIFADGVDSLQLTIVNQSKLVIIFLKRFVEDTVQMVFHIILKQQ